MNPADGKVTGPSTTTQTPNGTTTSQTYCTVSPNSDAATLANKPVSVACTTTTTNPDGTTSTSTTTTTPTTTTDPNAPPASSPSATPPPASSPIPCGLGTNGSPKCLIDETGTPTKVDGATGMAQPATDLQTAEQIAETQLQSVNNNRSWTLTMPHILPGGSCQPIEWFRGGAGGGHGTCARSFNMCMTCLLGCGPCCQRCMCGTRRPARMLALCSGSGSCLCLRR